MKKKVFALLLAGIMITSLAACGKNNAEIDNDSFSADDDFAIMFSDNDIVYNDNYVELAEYKNLSVTKNIYTVTQDAVDEEISFELSEYADYHNVDRAAKEGDYVSLTFTGSVGGEVVYDEFAEDSYEIFLGDAEYGEDFDQALTGTKAGDSVDFSVTYTDDNTDEYDAMADFIGTTVDFHANIESVSEEILPDFTDEFIAENLEDVSTWAEFEQSIRDALEEEYTETSESEVQDTLISQVVATSTIKDYPDALYQAFYESTFSGYQDYAEAFGQSTEKEDVLDMFGITEDELAEEALDSMYRYMVIKAIAEKENITISDEDFDAKAAEYALQNEYPDTETFLEDYGEENIRNWMIEEEVLNFLEANADITEQPAEYPTDEW